MGITVGWREPFTDGEVNRLHAEAFGTRLYADDERPWTQLLDRHSLGWCVARDGALLVGFANVLWDGLVHAWIQDVMVASPARGSGMGTRLVRAAAEGARAAGCEMLHVDFNDDLRAFYYDACGFTPTNGGLLHL
ncbi:MAG: GNAT family N-acetyltransferase [Nocardioides sp.]